MAATTSSSAVNYHSHFLQTFLFLIAMASFLSTTTSARNLPETTNIAFIKTSCGATAYPKLCYASLASQATVIRSDPKLLANAALSVTLDTAKSTSAAMVNMAKGRGMSQREVGAMSDCVEELRDSVDQLRRSLADMEHIRGQKRNFALSMSDVETWVSAALTDDDTCTEGFAGKSMDGKAKVEVRERILNVAHLTSNALALINAYASLHG